VYLNGAIHGVRSRETDRRFDEIVAFAGVERFLDTPLKRYSTGMQLRLAFAVAAHIESDIMLVDEVLAVGDTEFQRKCMTKVRSMGMEGRTVVFVSHDLDTVSSLCPRSIWLDRSRVVASGQTDDVVDRYLTSGVAQRGRHRFEHAPGQPVTMHGLAVLDDDGVSSGTLRGERPFTLEVDYTLHERVPGFDLALSVSSTGGTRILEEAFSRQPECPDRGAPGRYRAALTIPPILRGGEYMVSVWAGSAYDENLVWEEHALTFRLLGNAADRYNRLLDLGLPFQWDRLTD
jgi:ABC-2 type transport system ATP-binding protein/lipopolysaccharide transport system ATP-binding protein